MSLCDRQEVNWDRPSLLSEIDRLRRENAELQERVKNEFRAREKLQERVAGRTRPVTDHYDAGIPHYPDDTQPPADTIRKVKCDICGKSMTPAMLPLCCHQDDTVTVPREPTEDMLLKIAAAISIEGVRARYVYEAMLAAAEGK